jgi:hypothetical protein
MFSVILSFYLLIINKFKLKYLAVGFAAFVKYEAMLLIPIFLLDDYLFQRRLKESTFLGMLASIGPVLWILLAYISFGTTRYIQQVEVAGTHAGLNFLRSITIALIWGVYYGSNRFGLILVGILVSCFTLVGVISFHRSRYFMTAFLWLVGYTGVHMYFWVAHTRYVLQILWLLLIFSVYGVHKFLSQIRIRRVFPVSKPLQILIMVLLLVSAIVVQYVNKSWTMAFLWVDILLTFVLVSLLAITATFGLKIRNSNRFLVCSAIIFLFITISGAMFTGDDLQQQIGYQMIQFREVGEWYKTVAKEGDVLVATSPGMIQYYSGLQNEYFLSTSEFDANTTEEFISELKNRGVTYVVWDSKQGNRPKDYYYYSLNVELISFLSDGTDKPHFKVVHTVNIRSRIAYVYKFSP